MCILFNEKNLHYNDIDIRAAIRRVHPMKWMNCPIVGKLKWILELDLEDESKVKNPVSKLINLKYSG